MQYIWFAIGFVGFLIVDELLNGDLGEDDDGDGGERRPDAPGPRPSGDSMPVSLDQVELVNGVGSALA